MSMSSNEGSLNQTTGDFGINHSGGSNDASALIDNVEGKERMNISFNATVVVSRLLFEEMGNSDSAEIYINNVLETTFTGENTPDSFLLNLRLNEGDVLGISAGTGNGFSLAQIGIGTIPIPEPSSCSLFALGSMSLLFRRSRKLPKKSNPHGNHSCN
ncbi:PEP-CTERM sorting domain-containing protein [Persicirhabdus sediminis]|uniref:PEP-CTERM sorting domain-containing protein n=2 Tax=Persicirhabdus sediminis TaxID=454144 RepID=A0A8J7MH14_9BACT|nr:PEP-CTERM sorting domain-containing protein [Persicirhabdus sediminis]